MMNKPIIKENFLSNASPPWQKLPGRIKRKEKKKVYNKESEFNGNTYFKLQIVDEELKEKEIFVYPNIAKKKIFSDITNNIHIDNWYFFFCQKKGKRLILYYFTQSSYRYFCLSNIWRWILKKVN